MSPHVGYIELQVPQGDRSGGVGGEEEFGAGCILGGEGVNTVGEAEGGGGDVRYIVQGQVGRERGERVNWPLMKSSEE